MNTPDTIIFNQRRYYIDDLAIAMIKRFERKSFYWGILVGSTAIQIIHLFA